MTSNSVSNTFCFVLQHTESGAGAIFFNFLELCIQMVLLSHFYHNTVIPMTEQQQSFFALRSPAAVRRARGLQQFFCQTIRTVINSLCSLARAPTRRV